MARVTYTDLLNGLITAFGDELNARFSALKTAVNKALCYQGDWLNSTAYKENDVVTYGGVDWQALQDSTGVVPASGAYWKVFGGSGGAGHTIKDQNGDPVAARTYLGFDGDSVEVLDDSDTDTTIVAINHQPAAQHNVAQPVSVEVDGDDAQLNEIINVVATGTISAAVSTVGGKTQLELTGTSDAYTEQGNWATATSYAENDIVQNGTRKSTYRCKLAHTSSGTSEPGVGGSWTTYWTLWAQAGQTGATGATGATGSAGATGATGPAPDYSAHATYTVTVPVATGVEKSWPVDDVNDLKLGLVIRATDVNDPERWIEGVITDITGVTVTVSVTDFNGSGNGDEWLINQAGGRGPVGPSDADTTQSANTVKAGPTSGSAAAPAYRALVPADIPTITSSKLSDFTEAVQDAVAAALVAGSGQSITYDDVANTITFVNTAPLTQEAVEDFVAAMVAAGTNITASYNDTTGQLTISSTGDGTGFTQEQIEDMVAALLVQGTNVTLSYNDASGQLTITAAGGGSSSFDERDGWLFI